MAKFLLKFRRAAMAMLGKAITATADTNQMIKANLVHGDKFEDALCAIDENRFQDAIAIFLGRAMEGDAAAQNNLGVLFEMSNPRQDKLAEEYYRKAADQGLAVAQFNLAAVLAADIMIGSDQRTANEQESLLIEAYIWLLKANRKGHALAHSSLSRLREHMTEDQVERAYKQAFPA